MKFAYPGTDGKTVKPHVKDDGDGRVLVVQLPSGRNVPVSLAANRPESGAAVDAVRGLTVIAHQLDTLVLAANQNQFLSPTGREAQTMPARRDAITRAAHVVGEFLRQHRDADEALARLFAPPMLEQGAALEVALDRECRDFWFELSVDERLRLLNEIIAGEHKRLALALARSPVPLPEPTGKVIADAIKTALRDSNPGEILAAELTVAECAWADSLVPSLVDVVIDIANLQRPEVFGLIADAKRDSDGVLRVFGIDPSRGGEAGTLRRMRAAKAAA